jgi:hypothetical protein
VNPGIKSQKFSPAGQFLKKAYIWHLLVCTRVKNFKKFQNLSQTVFEHENVRDGQIANSTILRLLIWHINHKYFSRDFFGVFSHVVINIQ